ncbi:MAG: sodium:proton antiporter [Clostridiales bacterium]|nr:sodium:proton antiporter [Clostridiales bacterium]
MNLILPVLVALPLLAAVPAYTISKKKWSWGIILMIAVTLAELILAGSLFLTSQQAKFSLQGIIGLTFNLTGDGFRTLYALVAIFMWLMTSLFSIQYMKHGHAQGRYCLFTLLTLGATLGVFLSDDLVTAFLFFEILSFTSYCWVIHEETPEAMRAGQTYLSIAILGGMSMLMGLMMLHVKIGTLHFSELAEAMRKVDRTSLYLPGTLILAGFGAKAGMFPLHVWLPKSHPVAPAPASALLSGILTKVGIFGILVISTRLFFDDLLWGNLLLGVGLINMMLGALLALFSVDLKRTLACSSMSQIGFILFGIGMQSLLGEHNALAAQGTVLHMLNHSLIKLVLFMAAGVFYLNVHALNLNDIRGYGRKRPGLMLIFLTGAASISGVPFFSGYASKTLLHESIIEYIAHLKLSGHSALWYQGAEWLFVITGGLTLCYMIKLFVVLFIEKHPSRQDEFDKMASSMSPLSLAALGGSALVLFLLGLRPQGFLTGLANRSLPFLLAHKPAHEVYYLALVNLVGAGKSILLGVILYFTMVRLWLMGKDAHGVSLYLNRWPVWLDLEDKIYRPLVKALIKLGFLVFTPFDKLMDKVLIPSLFNVFTFLSRLLEGIMDKVLIPSLFNVFTFLSRLLEGIVDGFSFILLRTVLKRKYESDWQVPSGNRLTYFLGHSADILTSGLRRLFGMRPKEPQYYVFMYAAIWTSAQDNVRRLLHTLSFDLILFCLVLVALLAFLLIK